MKKIILSLCLLVQVMTAQNNYGEFTYPHSNASILSCGVTATLVGQPGFILAGYNLGGAPYNFTIDRTQMGGAFTGTPFEFQKEYQIYADITGACVPSFSTSIASCHGVSIIETSLINIPAIYAVAGAFDEGCFLAFLDNPGSVINTNVFWFPFPAGTNPSTITKPIIREDPLVPGDYYICGSYNNTMYAMRINSAGTTTWTNTYAINGQVNDMTLSSGGDPVIVGNTTINNAVPDGFVINLSSVSGAVNVFKVYDYNYYNQSFSSISPAVGSGAGYIIGGVCEISPGVNKAYNLYVDPAGSSVWDNVIYSNADAGAGNFVGIVERLSSFYGTYEYFGVMTSTAGIVVSRMDDNGIPCWGAPAPTTSRLDEFVFDAPGTNLTATGISYLNASAGYDEGLHIFGTDNNGGTNAPYLAQAYFDGHSGCNIPAFHFSTWSSVCSWISMTPFASSTGLGVCNAINISDANMNSKINYCGPASSVSNSSNNRTTSITETVPSLQTSITVVPDGKKNQVTLECMNCDNVSEISITDLLGQQLYHKTNRDIISGSTQFNDLNLPNGIYFINLTTDKNFASKKFVYSNQ